MRRYVTKYRKTTAQGGILDAALAYLPGLFMLFLAYKAFGKFSDLIGPSDSEDNSQGMVDSIKVNTGKMSFTYAQAVILAGKLFQAMNPHPSFSPSYDGTDEEAIAEVFSQIKTADDMRAVYKVFGVRDYKTVFVTDMMELTGWLKAELSDSLFKTVNIKLSWI